jgi:outer membrane protein assembly factor BamB
MRHALISLALAATAFALPSAEDWPQILGPTRDGVYRGAIKIADTWPTGGPKIVWKRTIGAGLAGPVVAGGKLYLHHRVQKEEVIEAFDAQTGTPAWRYAYPTTYRDDFGFDEGPRAVPVVAGGRVFTYGAEGELTALDAATGALAWRTNAMRQFGVAKGYFGAAGSPLVDGTRVILNVGGKANNAGIVALDTGSGKVLWTATNHEASYSSGTMATLGGTHLAVFLTREGLVALNPATGAIRFQLRWRARSAASVNAATPLISGDSIFISASYSTGATLLQVTADGKLSSVWSDDETLSNHYATSVLANGVLYGFHGRQEYSPSLRAVELKTGKVRWNEDRFGSGTVTAIGNRLLVTTEEGELILAPLGTPGYAPLARAKVLPATVRAYPAFADGLLYLRNDRTLAAFDLR